MLRISINPGPAQNLNTDPEPTFCILSKIFNTTGELLQHGELEDQYFSFDVKRSHLNIYRYCTRKVKQREIIIKGFIPKSHKI